VAFTDRIPYQAQVDRPKLNLPDGKQLAVWVILNVEEWRIENAMPRTVLSPPMGQAIVAGRAKTGPGTNMGCAAPVSGGSSRR